MLIQESGGGGAFGGSDAFAGTPYRLVRRLGGRSSGEVLLVEHWELGREMVAKVLPAGLARDARLLDRVRLEATTLARLNHPNVVRVSDFRHTADGRPFIIVELLRGRSLKEELAERGALGLFQALDFAHQALSGLGAAHDLGIAHRDVSPASLFLAADQQGVITLKVLDFGLARVLPGASTNAPRPLSLPTESGVLIGTPRYLSPEALLGNRVDQRADLYAVALILYEMIAGCGPFDRHAEILAAHCSEEPAPPSQLAQQPVPVEIDAVIQRGLRKDPKERFQSAREFQHELETLWQLLHQSHAFATTYFVVDRQPALRTTGDLPNGVAKASSTRPTPSPSPTSSPSPSPSPSEASRPGRSPSWREASSPSPSSSSRSRSSSSKASSATPSAAPSPAALESEPPSTRQMVKPGPSRSKLLALAVLVALITAVTVASGIAALLVKAVP
jgi:eukaryotic-like serine/threonine-protein kinase